MSALTSFDRRLAALQEAASPILSAPDAFYDLSFLMTSTGPELGYRTWSGDTCLVTETARPGDAWLRPGREGLCAVPAAPGDDRLTLLAANVVALEAGRIDAPVGMRLRMCICSDTGLSMVSRYGPRSDAWSLARKEAVR